jgi:hypothetical protein
MKPQVALLVLLAIFSGCENNDITPEARVIHLKSVTSYFEHDAGNFQPSSKTKYAYDAEGDLSQKSYSTYDIMEQDFTVFSTANFTFKEGKLEKIVEVIGTSLTKTTTFEYSADKLVAIHIDDEVDTDATIQYLENGVIEVLYTHSNGRFFKYRISSSNDNIVTEQTFDESGNLSSEIVNEFDSGTNPFSILGYHDPFFTNFSQNNKVKTISEYYSSFPTMVPVSYEYVYNEKNLPTEQTTAFQAYPNGQTIRHMKNVFVYDY